MEEQQPPLPLPSAPFPGPPPFWKHFTTTNIQRLKDVQPSTNESTIAAIVEKQLTQSPPRNLPLELTYLLPPPPPHASNQFYVAFNNHIPLSPIPPPLDPSVALFNTTSTQLTQNLPAILARLTRSILLNFLELTTVLSTPTMLPTPPDPPLWQEKIADLERLFKNALYCVNLYRPHQARESVIERLEDQVEKAEEEIRRLDEVKGRIEGFLAEMAGGITVGNLEDEDKKLHGRKMEDENKTRCGVGTESKAQDNEDQQARRIWKAIRKLDEE